MKVAMTQGNHSSGVFDVPIVILVFNRPEFTKRIISLLRPLRPATVLVVSDGPRADRPGEDVMCAKVREEIETGIDWPCNLERNYSQTNLGCAARVSSGLTWAFSLVERAIVLEDDLVPHPSFFPFCEELLERYANDTRVFNIGGNNFQNGRHRGTYSYYFSRYMHCWGWASWRRAWNHYDHSMSLLDELEHDDWLLDICDGNRREARKWADYCRCVLAGNPSSWATRWMISCWQQSGLTILPDRNLVSNTGFGSNSTHTQCSSPFEAMPTIAMDFPLRHPPFLIRDTLADAYTFVHNFDEGRLAYLRKLLWRFMP